MRDSDVLALLLLIIGLLFSLYYGFKAAKIFHVETTRFAPSEKLHQFWLNFLGSALGWLLFGFGVARVLQCVDQCSSPVGLWDAVLLFAGFVGVTGHLPMATVGLIQHFVRLVQKHAGSGDQK
jgi:hypothetical protein